jgi:hypothetical protein
MIPKIGSSQPTPLQAKEAPVHRSLFVCVSVTVSCAALVCGCGTTAPPKRGSKTKVVSAARPSRRPAAVRPRPETRRAVARLPSGPALAPLSVAMLEFNRPQTMAVQLRALAARAGFRPSTARISRTILGLLCATAGLSGLETSIDPARTLRIALVTPATRFKISQLMGLLRAGHQRVFEEFIPRPVALIPLIDEGEKLLSVLEAKTHHSVSTSWGGYAFRHGKTRLWVHIRGRWAVVATHENHLRSAWRYLKKHKSNAPRGALRLELDFAKLHPFFGFLMSIAKMVRGNTATTHLLHTLSYFIAVMKNTSGVSMQIEADQKRGLRLQLTGKKFSGAMLSWLRSLKKPSLRLLHALPGNAFFTILQAAPRSERLWWIQMTTMATKAWLQKQTGLPQAERTRLQSKIYLLLDGYSRCLGKESALALSFDAKHRPAVTYITHLHNTALFSNTSGKVGAFLQKEINLLMRAVWGKIPQAGQWKASKRARRLRGKKTHWVRLSRATVKKRVPKKLFAHLFGDHVYLAAATAGKYGIMYLGRHPKKALARAFAALQTKRAAKRKPKSKPARLIAKHITADTVSVGALAAYRLLRGALDRLLYRTPKTNDLHIRLKRLRTVLNTPTNPPTTVLYTGKRQGKNYRMRLDFAATDIVTLLRLWKKKKAHRLETTALRKDDKKNAEGKNNGP